MNHVLLVRVTHGAQHLADVVQRIGYRDGAALQLVGHGGSFDVFHHHVELVVGSERGSKRGNIRMIQAGHQFDLALETRGQFLPSRQIRKKDLHRFDAIRDDISHAPDPAHSAAAQLIQNLVIADPLVFRRSFENLLEFLLGNKLLATGFLLALQG